MLKDTYEELCYQKNTELWLLFCLATNRDASQPNYVWTVRDVIDYLQSRIKGSNNHDTR